MRLPLRACVPVAGTAMLGFVLLVHREPEVLRAAVMSSVTLAVVLLRRPARSLIALCVAVLVLLAVDRLLARTYGFVLSTLGARASWSGRGRSRRGWSGCCQGGSRWPSRSRSRRRWAADR